MSMVLLDGQFVGSAAIDPARHRFLGMFRRPEPPHPTPENRWDVLVCSCGQNLWSLDAAFQHWHDGHMDYPQYLTIAPRDDGLCRTDGYQLRPVRPEGLP